MKIKRGDTLMTSTLTGWGLGCGEGGGIGFSEYSEVQSLFFFVKENWICAMTRHHTEPKNNISLTRNLPFDSDVRQWSHPLTIPLHCLWAKLNNRVRGQFPCNVTSFCFDIAWSLARCGSVVVSLFAYAFKLLKQSRLIAK